MKCTPPTAQTGYTKKAHLTTFFHANRFNLFARAKSETIFHVVYLKVAMRKLINTQRATFFRSLQK